MTASDRHADRTSRIVFAWAFTSMQPIYPAEVMSNDMRAKGMVRQHLREQSKADDSQVCSSFK